MKKIILLFIYLIAAQSFAQTNGISYQAIILNPKGEQLPGANNASSPLFNKEICMVFKFVDEFSNIEYQETVQIKTDSFGMVNLVIGKGTKTAGYAADFQSILWNSSKKSLVVGINTSGNCTAFMEISNQDFTYAPLAFSAINAENVTGIVAVENGGTNSVTVLGAKTNLKIENVDNTTDLNKPLSTASKSALDLKENTANKSTDGAFASNSDLKFPTEKAVKTYVAANALEASTALTAEIIRAKDAAGVLSGSITTEAITRGTADATLNTNLAAEITRAMASEIANTNAITSEAKMARAAELANANNIITQTTRAMAAETANAYAISVEATLARAAELANTNSISTETTRATAAETANAYDISVEATLARAAELANANTIITETTKVTAAAIANANAISAEATLARAAELENTNAIVEEASIARTAEMANDDTIATETTNRTSADLLKANLASPSFTGTPIAPTATSVTNTTQIATTAFVNSVVSIATTGIFVDKTTNQLIDGIKTFSSDISANGIKIGKGLGNGDSNIALGTNLGTGTGYRNTGLGSGALNSYSGTSFGNNTGIGFNNMIGLTTGYGNTSVGAETMFSIAGSDNNTAIGNQTLMNSAASNNTAVGANAGGATTGSGNTFLGMGSTVSDGAFYNATAIGYQASVTANNTIQLGNINVTDVKTSGTITAGEVKYPNTRGINGQVLTSSGDGSLSWTSVSNSASSIVLHTEKTSSAFVTIENLNFRYNSNTQTIEVQTISGNLNTQVYVTKKTFGNTLAEGGTIKNYKNTAHYNSSWLPIIQLWNIASSTYKDIITINYYETMEANIHNMGTNTIPQMPNQTYRLFATIDGYNNVLIRVDFAR